MDAKHAAATAAFSLAYFALIFMVILLVGIFPWKTTSNQVISKLLGDQAQLECRPKLYSFSPHYPADYPEDFSMVLHSISNSD